jgi:hypothetical protein
MSKPTSRHDCAKALRELGGRLWGGKRTAREIRALSRSAAYEDYCDSMSRVDQKYLSKRAIEEMDAGRTEPSAHVLYFWRARLRRVLGIYPDRRVEADEFKLKAAVYSVEHGRSSFLDSVSRAERIRRALLFLDDPTGSMTPAMVICVLVTVLILAAIVAIMPTLCHAHLSSHIREIAVHDRVVGFERWRARAHPPFTAVAEQYRDRRSKRIDSVEFDPTNQGCLGGVLLGDDEFGEACVARTDNHGKNAVHRTQRSVECEFSEGDELLQAQAIDLFIDSEQCESDRKIEARALFANVCRREVHK